LVEEILGDRADDSPGMRKTLSERVRVVRVET
jgi:hypothetical protein